MVNKEEAIRQIVYQAYKDRPREVKIREFFMYLNPWYWIQLLLMNLYCWKHTSDRIRKIMDEHGLGRDWITVSVDYLVRNYPEMEVFSVKLRDGRRARLRKIEVW